MAETNEERVPLHRRLRARLRERRRRSDERALAGGVAKREWERSGTDSRDRLLRDGGGPSGT